MLNYRFAAYLLVSSLTAGFASEADAQGKNLKPVSMLLHYHAIGEHAAMFYGIEKGFFAAEGIDLKLVETKGSADATKQLIAKKEFRFAWADAGAMLKVAHTEKADVVMIGNFMQTSAAGLATFKDKNIKTIKDMVGKKISFAPNDSSRITWAAAAKLNGIDRRQYVEVLLAPEVKLNALLTGTADAMGGLATAQAGMIEVEPEAKGREVHWLFFEDLGIGAIAGGVFIRKADMADKDLNCRFMRAFTKPWTEAMKDPNGTVEAIHKAHPKTSRGNKAATMAQWKAASERLYSKNSKGMAPGVMAAADWESLVKFQREYGELKDLKKPTDYYTNEFMNCK